MKAFVIFGALFLAQSCFATTVVVFNQTTCSSGRDAVVLVKYGGVPANGVRVDIYQKVENGERSYWTGVSRPDGSAHPIKLVAGTYRVFADAGKHDATMKLIVGDFGDKATSCALDVSPPDIALHQPSGETPRVVLKDFRGIVQDANEAVLPRLSVRLLRMGSQAGA